MGLCVAAEMARDGTTRLKVYVNSEIGGIAERYQRFMNCLIAFCRPTAVDRLRNLIGAVGDRVVPAFTAIDIAKNGVGRLKLYFRPRDGTPALQALTANAVGSAGASASLDALHCSFLIETLTAPTRSTCRSSFPPMMVSRASRQTLEPQICSSTTGKSTSGFADCFGRSPSLEPTIEPRGMSSSGCPDVRDHRRSYLPAWPAAERNARWTCTSIRCAETRGVMTAASDADFGGAERLQRIFAGFEATISRRPIWDFSRLHSGIPIFCEVSPRSSDEVIAIVRLARRHRVALRTRGCGHALNGPRSHDKANFWFALKRSSILAIARIELFPWARASYSGNSTKGCTLGASHCPL